MSLIHSRVRALGGLVAASTLALTAPAWAEQASTTPVAQAADGLVVVRDAETGLLRMPTAEEAAALTPTKAAATGRSATRSPAFLPKRHSSGAIGVRANDDIASYSVVTKRADGTLAEACVDSKSEAEQAVQSGLVPVQQAAVEK